MKSADALREATYNREHLTAPEAYEAYHRLEPVSDLGDIDPDYLAKLQRTARLSLWPPIQHACGWMLIEQAHALPDDAWRKRQALLTEAAFSWQRCYENRIFSDNPETVEGLHPKQSIPKTSGYRAAVAGTYIPIFKEHLTGVPEESYSLYDQLLAVAVETDMERHGAHRDNPQTRSDLLGLLNELTVLLLTTRARERYGLPLLAIPSLPRQQEPRQRRFAGYSWQVTLYDELRNERTPIKVKNKRREEDESKYHEEIKVVSATEDLTTKSQQGDLGALHVLIAEQLTKTTRPTLSRQATAELDDCTKKLFRAIQRDDLANLVPGR